MVRICRSRLSSFMAPIIAAPAGKPKNLRRGALWARAAAWRRHCLTVTGAHGHFRSPGKAATEGGAEGPGGCQQILDLARDRLLGKAETQARDRKRAAPDIVLNKDRRSAVRALRSRFSVRNRTHVSSNP